MDALSHAECTTGPRFPGCVTGAGNVTPDGSATVVVEVTPERVAGALVGLIFYLPVRLLQKLQRN